MIIIASKKLFISCCSRPHRQDYHFPARSDGDPEAGTLCGPVLLCRVLALLHVPVDQRRPSLVVSQWNLDTQ